MQLVDKGEEAGCQREEGSSLKLGYTPGEDRRDKILVYLFGRTARGCRRAHSSWRGFKLVEELEATMKCRTKPMN